MAADEDNDGVEQRVGDWTAYQDDEGRTYYYNDKTGESSWEVPPGFDDDGGRRSPVVDDATGDDDGGFVGNDGAGTPPYAATPPLDGSGGEDDVSRSPLGGDDDDGITRSPVDDNLAADADDGVTRSPSGDQNDDSNEAANEVAETEGLGGGWFAYQDDEGRTYYYNAETGETQWEKPDVASTQASSNISSQDGEKTGDSEAAPDGGKDSLDERPGDDKANAPDGETEDGTKGDVDEDKDPEPQDDPAAIAEKFLQEPDAVMEPSVFDHISALVNELGAQVAGPKAMQSLINGYQGDTAVCGVLGLWLADLKSTTASFDKGKSSVGGNLAQANVSWKDSKLESDRFAKGADAARDVVEGVLNRLAKERFTKDGGDAIMSLSKKQAAFVDEMIDSERWRKLLIDLSATNKDSKLFMYCLQSISNLGHHRAIANRIDQSDYFGVFNSMLASELAIAGKIAVDGYSDDVAASIDSTKGQMGSLVADLRRTCTSTSYTYLYATEVLKELISKSKSMKITDSTKISGVKRATRKWERLKEELEDEMLKPLATGTTFQKKRRIDVALTMSDLFLRQRRRTDEISQGNHPAKESISSKNELANILDSALIGILTKSSLGTQIDKELTENMLKFAYGGSTDRIGDLLVNHPSAIISLLRSMFGCQRIRQLETRQKCARLVALAVIASERCAQFDGVRNMTGSEEDFLCQVILKGSQLCEQVETMVSFAVLDSIENTDGSVGRQLSAMCIKYPVVAQGALIWAKELASGNDFVTTAGYPTVSPCILSLARLISIYHPLARPAVLDLSLIFMRHVNSEISHQKMQSIKEQCLRLMLWLSAQGLSLTVISVVQNKLRKGGSSEMDSALVRYFISGLLDFVRPPISRPFIRAFGSFLLERACVDALRSQHFEASKRSQLAQLINHFEITISNKETYPEVSEDDTSMISLLKASLLPSS